MSLSGGVLTFAGGALEAQASNGDPTYLWIATVVAGVVGLISAGVWLASSQTSATASPQQSVDRSNVGRDVLQAGRDIVQQIPVRDPAIGDRFVDFMDELRRLRHNAITDPDGDAARWEREHTEWWERLLEYISFVHSRARAEAVRSKSYFSFDTAYEVRPRPDNLAVLHKIEVSRMKLQELLSEN